MRILAKTITVALVSLLSRRFAVAEPNGVAQASKSTCSESQKVMAMASRAWKVDPSRIAITACAAGRFPMPGWVLAADITADGWGYFHRLAVVSRDGNPLAMRDGGTGKDLLLSTDAISHLATADFDGDGTDEIVATVDSAYKFQPTTTGLEVDVLNRGALQTLLRRGFRYATSTGPDSPLTAAEWLCDGNYEITRRSLVIHGRILRPLANYQNDKPECVDGLETYAAKDGAFTLSQTTATANAARSNLPKECVMYKAAMDRLASCNAMPQESKEALRQAYDAMSQMWANSGTTPDSRAAIAAGCKQGADALNQTGVAVCGW